MNCFMTQHATDLKVGEEEIENNVKQFEGDNDSYTISQLLCSVLWLFKKKSLFPSLSDSAKRSAAFSEAPLFTTVPPSLTMRKLVNSSEAVAQASVVYLQCKLVSW